MSANPKKQQQPLKTGKENTVPVVQVPAQDNIKNISIPKDKMSASSILSNKAAKPIATGSFMKSIMKSEPNSKDFTLLFDKENYMWMIGGIALIFIGFILMSGGKSANPHEFHYDEIYSFRRITLAPIVILAGFGIEVYAIMKKPKETAN